MKQISKYIIPLMLLVVFAVPWIGVSSSPVFPMFGVWHQSEPLVLALFFIGFLSCLSLTLLYFTHPKTARYVIEHPVVMLPFFIGCVPLLLSFMEGNRLSQLLGNVQTGLGAAWFLSIAVISAVSRCVFRVSGVRFKKVLVIYLIGASILVCGLSVVGWQQWRMFPFNDHLAFFAIFLWGLPFLIIENKKTAFLISITTATIIVVPSNNTSAVISIIGMAIGSFCYFFLSSRVSTSFSLRSLSGSLCIGVAVFISVFVQYVNNFGLFASYSTGLASTMYSRHLLSNTVFEALNGSLQMVITGAGWGQFSNLLIKRIPVEQTTLFNYQNAAFNEEKWMWDSLQRLDFHSHNLFVETWGATGLIGLFLLFVYVFSIVKFARRGAGSAAFGSVLGFVILNSMWFQMPSSVGVMSVAFGALSGRFTLQRYRLGTRYLGGLLLVTTLVGLFVAQLNVFKLGQQGAREVQVSMSLNPSVSEYCGKTISDTERNGVHFAEILKNFSARIDLKLKEDPELVKSGSWKRLSSFLCQADKRLKENNELLPGIRALMARSDFIIKHQKELNVQPYLFEQMVSGWEGNVERVLSLAPERGDLAIPYMNWLYQNKSYEKLAKIAGEISNERKTESLGKWFLGLVFLEEKGKQKYAVELMSDALSGNLERFFPVDAKLKQQLLGIGKL